MVSALADATTPTPVRRVLTYGLISAGASAALVAALWAGLRDAPTPVPVLADPSPQNRRASEGFDFELAQQASDAAAERTYCLVLALSHIHSAGAAAAVLRVARDERVHLSSRIAAVEGLGRMGAVGDATAALALLRDLLGRHKCEDGRCAAVLAIARLSQHSGDGGAAIAGHCGGTATATADAEPARPPDGGAGAGVYSEGADTFSETPRPAPLEAAPGVVDDVAGSLLAALDECRYVQAYAFDALLRVLVARGGAGAGAAAHPQITCAIRDRCHSLCEPLLEALLTADTGPHTRRVCARRTAAMRHCAVTSSQSRW